MALAVSDRVYHLSDRHRNPPRLGTVQSVYSAGEAGMETEYAEVLYDHDGQIRKHPTGNLVKVS